MSDEDPSDDELEREQASPMMRKKHAPQLGTESRAVSLAEMRGEEVMPSERRREARAQERSERFDRAPNPAPTPMTIRRPDVTNVSPLRSPPPSPVMDAPGCWARFAAAALPLVGSEADAAAVADNLLEQMRRRFG